jgi:hypothetical protein
MHAYNPSTHETGQKDLKFEASLGCKVRLCFKNKEKSILKYQKTKFSVLNND